MNTYGDIQYLIDRPEPSEMFLRARHLAGGQLQRQFREHRQQPVVSSYDGFKWIKAELTYPSFDNLTFAYRNSIFSVVIELIDNTGSSFTRQQKDRLLSACETHNLIPCTFRVNVRKKDPRSPGNYTGKKDQLDYELIPLAEGWNLYDARTGETIDPLTIARNDRVHMSKWELSNFAIQVVRNELEKEGNQILSFCDVPEVDPQIWFRNRKGEVGWILVKHIRDEREKDPRVWAGLEERMPQLKPYAGYFVPIQFFSMTTNSPTELYRGDGMNVDYNGLEPIYSPKDRS